jgi:NTE family protein
MLRRDLLRVAAATAYAGTLPLPAKAVTQEPRRALVLSGGGAHGAYEAGVIAALVASGTLSLYDIVCGTSIGSLNAALVATGQGAQVRQLWSTLAKSDILRPKREFAAFDARSSSVSRGIAALRFVYGSVRGRVTGFIDRSALRGLIASYLMLPGGVARPFVRPLLWTATDLVSACGVAFKREPASASPLQLPLATAVGDRDLVDALLASASISGAFDPVTLPGSAGIFVDGGVLDNLPLDLARAAAQRKSIWCT